MLLGSEIGAAETALEAFDCDIIGLNCATGPREMNDAVRFSGAERAQEYRVLPNAGCRRMWAATRYALTPRGTGGCHKKFVKEYGVRIVGGCCGTTPDHLGVL